MYLTVGHETYLPRYVMVVLSSIEISGKNKSQFQLFEI